MATDHPTERWLPVTEFPDHYEVSDLGRVRSLPRCTSGRRFKGVMLAQTKTGPGYKTANAYLSVMLCVGSVRYRRLTHLLVLKAFVGDPPEGYVCNHKDGQKGNNEVSNLEWVTQAENIRHSFDVLGNKWRDCPGTTAKLTNEDVRKAIEMRSRGMACKQVAEVYGVTTSCIQAATKGCGHEVAKPKGEAHKKAKLTEEAVRAIRRMRAEGWTQQALADRFGIGQSAVSAVVLRQTWAHIV